MCVRMRAVADVTGPGTNGHPGLGQAWRTDADRMKAAMIIDHHGYRSEPVFCVLRTAKRNDRQRIIYFPTFYDRAVQRMYTLFLEAACEPLHDPHLYSFRRGRSVSDAVGRVVEVLSGPEAPGWVAVCDISSFFESVSHDAVLGCVPMDPGTLKEILKAPHLLYGTDLMDALDTGLPTGGGLSPVLSDRVLDGLEATVKVEADVEVIRWVDDIIIAAHSCDDALRSMAKVRGFLYPKGLRLNREKSFVAPVSEGFEFLKFRFTVEGGAIRVEPSRTAIELLLTDISRGVSDATDERGIVVTANRILSGFARSYRSADLGACADEIDSSISGIVLERLAELRGAVRTDIEGLYLGVDRRGTFLRTGDGRRLVRAVDIVRVAFSSIPADKSYFIDRDWFRIKSERDKIERVAIERYRRIWWSTDGCCGVCGHPIAIRDGRDLVSDNGIRAYVHTVCRGGRLDPTFFREEVCSDPVWSPPEADASDNRPIELARLEPVVPARSDAIVFRTRRGTVSKYQGLLDHIQSLNYCYLNLSFKAVSDLVGGLPSTAYKDGAWWSRTSRSSIGEALSAIDWQVDTVDIDGAMVRFCILKTRYTLAEKNYLARRIAVDAERHVALRDARLEKAWFWRITRFLLDSELDQITLSFEEFENIIKHRLTERAFRESRYWTDRSCGAPLLAIEDGDFEMTSLDLEKKRMVLTRTCCIPDPKRDHVPKGDLPIKEHMKRKRPGFHRRRR